MRYVLNETGDAVHSFADCIVDDRHGNFLQHAWQWTIFVESPPAGDKCRLANKVDVTVGHTNRYDVGLEDYWLIESESVGKIVK